MVAKDQNRDLKFAFRFRSLTKLVAGLMERRRREPEPHFDFLGMLMDARDRDGGAPMGDKEIIDEVMTLIVAGHETTAAALTWAWYLISQHPQTAERTRRPRPTAARRHARARRGRIPAIHPPGAAGGAAAVSRRAGCSRGARIEADELGGFPIGPRTDVFISPYMLHRHPGILERAGGIQARSGLPAPMPRSGTNSPTSPSRWGRATASARTWPCSRCWCTCRP